MTTGSHSTDTIASEIQAGRCQLDHREPFFRARASSKANASTVTAETATSGA